MKRVRAGAVIVHQGKMLLLWRKFEEKEYYVFPGGGKEDNETIEEAVEREALEETSLTVKVDRLLYIFTVGDNENHFYLCSYVSGEPKLGKGPEQQRVEESNQYRPMWVPIETITDLELKPREVKGWFIEDSDTGFSGEPRIHTRKED